MAWRRAVWKEGGRWMTGLEKVADCKDCLSVCRDKKNSRKWEFCKMDEGKNNRGFLKGNGGGFKFRFCCCYCRFCWVSFLGSATAESLQIILDCSSLLPPNLLLLPKSTQKKPRQRSAEVVSGGSPFPLSPQLFAHDARPSRPLVRKYWE